MPKMMERYDRKTFAINRFFRIFPTLLFVIVIAGVTLGLSQQIYFSPIEWFGSITLTYPWLGVIPVLPILWTLVIEVIFYCLVLIIGKFTTIKILTAQAVLLLVIFLGVKFQENYYIWLAGYNARYLLMIFIGSCIYMAEKENNLTNKIGLIFSGVTFSYLGFQIFYYSSTDLTSYSNIRSQLLAVLIFLVFMFLGTKYWSKVPLAIQPVAQMVYPIYLLHGLVGFLTMFYLRNVTQNPFILVSAAVISTFAISWVVHIFVEEKGLVLGKKTSKFLEKILKTKNLKQITPPIT